MIITKFAAIILAYLLGSIPSSVWLGKTIHNIDLREHGSGNAGFTNAVRVLGWKTGIPVFLIDIFKGWASANLVRLFGIYVPGTPDFVNMQLVLGVAAVVGHIFPVYVGFKGGKGVATLLGIVLAVAPLPTLLCFGIFITTLFITRYVSLSSIMAGISFPIMMIFVYKTTMSSLIIFSLIAATLLLLTHQKNIERIIRNEENKANILKKRNRSD